MLNLRDLLSIHCVYNSLSSNSKSYYKSVIYGKPKSPIWFLAQIALIISHTPFAEIIRYIYPKYVYFIIGAFDEQNHLVGFAHVVLHGYSADGKLIGRIAIAIKDEWQGKKLGTELMDKLIRLAKEKAVDVLYLEVKSTNKKGLALYTKFGFKIIKVYQRDSRLKDKLVDLYEMKLYL